MPLDPKARAELERRGAYNVRAMLLTGAAGHGQGASVRLEVSGLPDPSRVDVESWLREQDLATEKLATDRHAEQIEVARAGVTWARKAYWAGIGSIIVTIIFGLLSLIR